MAARTGLTPSHISVLERTSSGASYNTLSKLTKCYRTTMHDLNREAPIPEEIQILRGHGRSLPSYLPGVYFEQLAEGPLKMDATRVRVDPGAGSGQEPYSHPGEEFIYVIEGSVEITFDGLVTNLLEVGDCVYFSSSRLHSWRNPGTPSAEVIWINTTPSFLNHG